MIGEIKKKTDRPAIVRLLYLKVASSIGSLIGFENIFFLLSKLFLLCLGSADIYMRYKYSGSPVAKQFWLLNYSLSPGSVKPS